MQVAQGVLLGAKRTRGAEGLDDEDGGVSARSTAAGPSERLYLRRRRIIEEDYELMPSSSAPQPPTPVVGTEAPGAGGETEAGAAPDAPGSPGVPEMPEMPDIGNTARSSEEVYATAHGLAALRPDDEVTERSLCEALALGHRNGKVDAGVLPGVAGAPPVLLEYDGKGWHLADRLQGDVDKTKRMLLAMNSSALVVRLRFKDAPALPLQDPRLVIVPIERPSPAHVAYRMAAALAPHMPEPLASKLRAVKEKTSRPAADKAAHLVLLRIGADYRAAVKERKEFLEAELGMTDVPPCLVSMPLSTIRAAMDYLLDDLGMSKAKIASAPNLLTYSVESNLKHTVTYLTEELGMSKAKIASTPALLWLSVESNLKHAVTYLTEELGMSKAKIASTPALLWLSVESNLKHTVTYLTEELGMSKAKIASAPALLWLSVESNLKHTVTYLTEELGMSKAKIASAPALLWLSVESNLKHTVTYLTEKLGMSKAKIASAPALLWLSVESNLKPTVEWLCEVPGLSKADISARLLNASLKRMKLVWQQRGKSSMTAPQKRSLLQRGKPRPSQAPASSEAVVSGAAAGDDAAEVAHVDSTHSDKDDMVDNTTGGAPVLTIDSGGDGDGGSESDVEHDVEPKCDSEEVAGEEVRVGALPTNHVDKEGVTDMDVAGGEGGASKAEPRLAPATSTNVVKDTQQTKITSFFVRPPTV